MSYTSFPLNQLYTARLCRAGTHLSKLRPYTCPSSPHMSLCCGMYSWSTGIVLTNYKSDNLRWQAGHCSTSQTQQTHCSSTQGHRLCKGTANHRRHWKGNDAMITWGSWTAHARCVWEWGELIKLQVVGDVHWRYKLNRAKLLRYEQLYILTKTSCRNRPITCTDRLVQLVFNNHWATYMHALLL